MAASKPNKRDLILDTAFQLFIQRGYMETRIIDIAEACGMGKGTFYEYFDSKEVLFEELFQKHVVEKYKNFPLLLKGGCQTSRQRLEAFFRFEKSITKMLGNQKNLVDNIMNKLDLLQGDSLKKVMNDFFQFRFQLVKEIIETGMEAGEFKKGNATLATVAVLGALYFYFNYSIHWLSQAHPISIAFPRNEASETDVDSDTDEEFHHLILYGLTRQE